VSGPAGDSTLLRTRDRPIFKRAEGFEMKWGEWFMILAALIVAALLVPVVQSYISKVTS
jgi:hypothetical protein